MESIQYQYGPPEGALILATNSNWGVIGCVGIRKLEDSICELKRMYVSSGNRGFGIGKSLIQHAFTRAYGMGYSKMRLDTLPSMSPAIHLYKSLEFYEIQAYRYNPVEGTVYFEKILSSI